MKSILDPSFRYYSAVDTDLRRTFRRARRQLLEQQTKEAKHGGQLQIVRLPTKRQAANA